MGWIALVAFFAAALQSATGFGFALVLSPVVFAVLDPGEALTTLVVLSTALSALVLFSEGRDRDLLGRPLVTMLLWSLPGLVAGAAVLTVVDKPVLQVAVGVAVVAAVAAQAAAGDMGAAPGRQSTETAAAGLLCGALSTTTGVSGPPLVLWLARRGLDPHRTRDTLAAAFLSLAPLTAAALLAFGELDPAGVGIPALALMLVPVAAGRFAGRRVFMNLGEPAFRTVGYGLAVAAGIASVVAGLA